MALQDPRGTMSIDEFLDWSLTVEERVELLGGHVYAMAGASANHGRITTTLTRICDNALQGRSCEFFD